MNEGIKMLTIKDLERVFKTAYEDRVNYVAVKIEMQGFSEPEVIINHRDNFLDKLDYYKKSYNDDLSLKSFNGIRIIGITWGNTFEEIERNLI